MYGAGATPVSNGPGGVERVRVRQYRASVFHKFLMDLVELKGLIVAK